MPLYRLHTIMPLHVFACGIQMTFMSHMLPALKLRLGLDQECYDFIKWYATREEKGEYARGNMDNSFLHLRGEDVFEKLPVTMSHRSADLSHTVALTLLKLRLKLDIGVLQQSWIIGSKVPQEVMDNIQKHVVGDTVSWRKDIIGASDLTPLNKELDQQIQALIKAVETQNPYFWYGLFRPEIHLTPCSKSYTSGSPEEVRRVLQFSFDSWIETPGAMDLMRELLHGKV